MALPPSSTVGGSMKYVVLMYADPAETKAMSAAERDEVGSKHRDLRAELTVSGELVGGEAMAGPEDTVSLRLAGEDVAISHGPLLKSDEQLTAYYVLDCEDLPRAISIAGRILDFHVTAIEVRQVHDSVE
jgi:hypothetical protein